VGHGRPLEDSADLLVVNVTEGERMRSDTDPRNCPAGKICTGSVATYWKLAAFLRYAATQPEPMIGRGDDDVFLSPPMLLAHASLLARLSQPVFAGVFEWYSWRTQTLHSTGFGLSAGAARHGRKKVWRNCTSARKALGHDAAQHPVSLTTPRQPDLCVGPLAFAKGPLVMLSSSAVRWLVRSPLFSRDLKRAREMMDGRAPPYHGPGSGRIDDDVQLGYWMAQLPHLRVVGFRRYMAWHDRWKAGVTGYLPRLLQAHKVPWDKQRTLCNQTRAVWSKARRASVSLHCDSSPPCRDCAHVQISREEPRGAERSREEPRGARRSGIAPHEHLCTSVSPSAAAGKGAAHALLREQVPTQKACAIDVALDLGPSWRPPPTCAPVCNFKKGSEPQLPGQCWAP